VTKGQPHWLGRIAVDEAHFRQIREHGGAHGVRDENALEAALARPRHRWTYGPRRRLADLAAAYAFGLIKDHAYLAGNKRIALVVMVAFLDLNDIELTATDPEVVLAMLSVAAGEMTEAELADWIAAHSRTSEAQPENG
jgi:death-on-curing protein